MEDFQKKYIHDARELIENLEGSLLKLEEDSKDPKIVEEIFRFMHTLKGSAGMFGFHKIEELTHHLENIYDSIRDGDLQIDDNLTELTLNAVDLIKELLNSEENLNKEKQEAFDAILQESKTLDENTQVAETIEKQPVATQQVQQDSAKLYFIRFIPETYIYTRGIRPMNVFKELSDISPYQAYLLKDKIPPLSKLKGTDFYLAWEIFMLTSANQDDIDDIFLFFEDSEYSIEAFDPKTLTKEQLLKASSAFTAGQLTFKELPLQQPDNTEEQQQSTANGDAPKKQAEKGTQGEREETVRVSAEKLDDLVNLVSDFVTLNSKLSLISGRLQDEELNKSLQGLSKLSKRFRENALDLRLMPIEVLVVKFKRLVRDLSRKMNKQVEFTAEGIDTKLDKSIIEKIETPLMHIIRNAIDHGVESPDERKALNKPEKGIIRMVSFYSGASVFVQIRDDGKGINKEYIRKRAIEKGIIKNPDSLTDEDIYNLIFQPGFSTAQTLTSLSGRGVGMDVVQKSITDLRGEINIESEVNLGTSVTLKLPLTLSIIDALLVKVSSWSLLVPISSVETVKAVTATELAQNKRMQIEYDGMLIPLINLRVFMEINGEIPEKQNIIVLNHEGKYYGMLVDQIKSEHQAVIKPLGYLHRKQEYLAGASILGDGSLALILNIKSLIKHKSESIHVS